VSGEEFHVLAEALRRVPTLMARGAPPETIVYRYEPDGAFTILGNAVDLWPVRSRWPVGGNNVATLVFETGRPARIENYAEATGGHVERAHEVGIRSSRCTRLPASQPIRARRHGQLPAHLARLPEARREPFAAAVVAGVSLPLDYVRLNASGIRGPK
jgi:hypothetical protein